MKIEKILFCFFTGDHCIRPRRHPGKDWSSHLEWNCGQYHSYVPWAKVFFFVVFVVFVLYCVFLHVCNSSAANIIIISLIPNWLVCFPCDRIDMLIHIIISKYLSQFVLWFPVFLLTFQNVILIIFVWHSMLSQLGKLPWKLYGREWGHLFTRLCDSKLVFSFWSSIINLILSNFIEYYHFHVIAELLLKYCSL